jgi:hypothetical protein
MDLRAELLSDYSRKHTLEMASAIIADPSQFPMLMSYFLDDAREGYRLPQRAAAVVNEVCEQRPDLLKPYYRKIVLNLRNDVHDAVKRNTVRLLQFHEIPEDLVGETADRCFEQLHSAKEPIAIKVFSMTVLFNIVKRIPELKSELQYMIEEQMPYGSGGFVSRGRKILKALKSIN